MTNTPAILLNNDLMIKNDEGVPAMMKCPKCEYEWLPRQLKPKKCPKCGHWLEYK